ncbi:ATP-binding protein [Sphingomonas metalli]|nr:ATP-binding protein [Sphingomonas metalli]
MFRLGELDRAAPLIESALNRIGPNQTELAGEVRLTRGSLRGAKSQFGGALTDFQNAFKIFERIDNQRSQAIALMLIASLYSSGKDYERALRYLTQASDIYRGDPGLMVALYNNRGGVLQDLKRHDEAEQQFRVALSYAEKMRSPVLIAQVLRNVARNRLKAGQVTAAEQAVRRSLAVAASGEAASWRPQLLALAAEAAFQRGNFGQAERLITQSFAQVDIDDTEASWLEPHLTAYRVFQRQGRYELAMEHLAAVKRIDDDATRLATSTSNALMAARFDFANQELRIAKLRAAELRRSIALEQARTRFQRTMFLVAGGATAIVILLLAIGLFTIRRSRNALRVARDGLAVTNMELHKALAAKTEFLATTSHEIRTPLNGILGMTQVMLADATLPPVTRDRLGVVQGAGLTMRALVDDILDVAKMETGHLTLDDQPYDLPATIHDAARLWEEEARAKGLDYRIDLADAPRMLMGDAGRIRQIVFNLLSNAVKFTSRGQVALTACTVDGGEALALTVSDSGIGIAPEKQGAIFESFRQADASTTRQFGGTGLGLAICRNLTVAMGGTITVRSEVGQGATFTVVIPVKLAAVPEPTAPLADQPALLVLDRSPITRAMWKTLLEARAGTLLFAATVDEAIAAIGSRAIARMLIDDATLFAAADPADATATLATAAQAAGVETTLLWSGDRDGRDGVAPLMTRIVAKPIAGAALAAMIFDTECDRLTGTPLVSRAA